MWTFVCHAVLCCCNGFARRWCFDFTGIWTWNCTIIINRGCHGLVWTQTSTGRSFHLCGRQSHRLFGNPLYPTRNGYERLDSQGEPVAVLTCYLCDQPAYKPIPVENRTFCCHGCRDLWRLLGDEQLAELKSRPGINWRAAQECSSNFPEASQSFLREAEATALNFHLGGLWCASCGILIEQVVRQLPGVLGIHLNYTDATL